MWIKKRRSKETCSQNQYRALIDRSCRVILVKIATKIVAHSRKYEREIGRKLGSRAPRTREEIRPLWTSPSVDSSRGKREKNTFLRFSSSLPFASFVPGGESTPENREALARNQATTFCAESSRTEKGGEETPPLPLSNRINRGVLAAVDASSLRRLPRISFPFVRFDNRGLPISSRSIGKRLHETTINEGAPAGRWREKGVSRVCALVDRVAFE